MNKLTNESAIADIAARFNELKGTSTDVKSLAKRGKAKLLDQIHLMEQALPKVEKKAEPEVISHLVEQLMPHNKADSKAAKKAPKDKKVVEKKVKGPVIRVEAEKLLLAVVETDEDKRAWGHSYDYILGQLHAQFPTAKTTVACLRWYAVHMRERGDKVPNRPRAIATVAAKTE